MPIYEFYCPDNNKLYSFLARSLSMKDKLPRCPDGEGLRMERRVSRFAVIGKAKEDTADDPFAGIDESKMDAFMAEMERDMGGLDEENPDPRQLGHFMRKMTDVMGDKTPPELREMVRRLEAGEDPEKLEEQFGGMDEGEAGDAMFSQLVARVKASRKEPVRDPKLYEMRDFVTD
ncbi:MAG: cytochrome C [Verrucomicrobiaceae bacterium]|nr:cytochrome C [Verrucomicrobiaceae bacterium]